MNEKTTGAAGGGERKQMRGSTGTICTRDGRTVYVVPWSKEGAVRIEISEPDGEGGKKWQSLLLQPDEVAALKGALNDVRLP